MRQHARWAWSGLAAVLVLLTACSGGTTAGAPAGSTVAATATNTATPTPPPAPSAVYVGLDHTVYALDARTGSQLWRYDAPQLANTNSIEWVTVVDDLMLLAHRDGLTLDSGSTLYALDKASGALRWKLPLARLTGAPADSQIEAASGVLYVSSTVQQVPSATYAIDERAGTLLWQTPDHGQMAVGATTLVLSSTYQLYGALPDLTGTLTAYDRTTGTQLWQIKGAFGRAFLDEHTVYTVAGGTVYAYDMQTGTSRWTLPLGGTLQTQTLLGSTLYLADSSQLYAVDITTHALLWHASTTGPVVAAGNLLCAGSTHLVGVDPSTGKQVWSQPNSGIAIGYSNGTCYGDASSPGHQTITAVDASTGTLRWSRALPWGGGETYPTAEAVYTSVSVTSQCCATQVVALSSATGATRWTFTPPPTFPAQLAVG